MRNTAAEATLSRAILRYAQCWEDADILLDALDITPGDTCLSIASAGDNTLSLLTRHPGRVLAVDLNLAQLAALELRVSAYRALSHAELLELMGSRPSARRAALYARCRGQLSAGARAFWDGRPGDVAAGIGGAGKLERYLRLFREWVLPLAHRRATVSALLDRRDPDERRRFFDERWNTPAWRLLFRVFFSATVLGRLGRDPALLRFADGNVAEHLLARVRHAFTDLDPAENPYLAWIFTGEHARTLPHALRAEHFETIRDNLDRLEWRRAPLEALTPGELGAPINAANLSDVFEYLAPVQARALFERITALAKRGARIAYWNMIVPRRGADYLPGRLRALPEISGRLFRRDKVCFYRDFIVEEVACN